jgi:hypothetical protein
MAGQGSRLVDRHAVRMSAPADEKARVDIAAFEAYKKQGLVRCTRHPKRDLLIWNYTETVQRKGPWDAVTNAARALVTDASGRVVARSFPKFHNLAQGKHTATPEFRVFDKMDGSLGLVFWHQDAWIACSRGSFVSEQAEAARAMLARSCDAVLDREVCYSVEIIYPENRVIVDYGARRALVFLAAFRPDGTEVFPAAEQLAACGFESVREVACADLEAVAALHTLNAPNAEGYVVRFSNGDRAKIKFADYLNLHRSRADMHGLRVWELFAAKTIPATAMLELLTDDPAAVAWFRARWDALQARVDAALADVDAAYARVLAALAADPHDCPKESKAFARAALREPLSTLLFIKRAGKDVWRAVVSDLRPKDGLADRPPFAATEAPAPAPAPTSAQRPE